MRRYPINRCRSKFKERHLIAEQYGFEQSTVFIVLRHIKNLGYITPTFAQRYQKAFEAFLKKSHATPQETLWEVMVYYPTQILISLISKSPDYLTMAELLLELRQSMILLNQYTHKKTQLFKSLHDIFENATSHHTPSFDKSLFEWHLCYIIGSKRLR